MSNRQRFLTCLFFLCFSLLIFNSQTAFAWWMWTPGDTVDNVGFKPEQPIPFNHKLHAGERKIPCEYCHSSARRAFSSGIPSSNTCIGCHSIVAGKSEEGKKHVQTIRDMYAKNEPIEWVKVHDLPDYVRFPHKRHILGKEQGGAGLACQECHGPVETMEVLYQHAPLQMGWCISCHKEKEAPLDCAACHY